ncbi:STAS domain-containing protein [Streptomyces sp. NPDC093089]|uniref:STAS domain-containing protein n=1 Tax=Streptomyces sp. NPDC093089 TaxID=3366024 RepID=UPI003808D169
MTSEFDARTSRVADSDAQAPVVRVSGEIDIQHAGELEDLLAAALADAKSSSAIIVDLSNSSFCDSSGLNVLIRAREAALRSSCTLRLAAPSHQMLRLLDLTGTTGLFPVQPAVAG